MPTAIVTGATGILGRAIVRELGQHSDFTQVYALSRSKKEAYPSNVKHHHVDLQASPDELAKELSGVEADYLFFAAYLAASSEEAHDRINGAMLKNFLLALRKTGAESKLKRVILVTGAKQYGLHLGTTKLPMVESDKWIDGPHRPPNFYYTQQGILKQESSQSSWDWTVTYPNDVQGVARGNFMNLVSTLGIYCAVSRELGGPGSNLDWPGSKAFYLGFDCYTDAQLHARFCLWAATAPKAHNEAFNVVNGDVESWQNMWPKLAQRFGLTIDPQMLSKPGVLPATGTLADPPPVDDLGPERGLKGYFKPSQTEQRIALAQWSQKEEVKKAWEKLAEREGLEQDAFEKATWGFLDFVLGRDYDIIISMNKARKAGWNDFQDTWDSFERNFSALEEERILPRISSTKQ